MTDHPINATAAEMAYADLFSTCGNSTRRALIFALEVLDVAADQAREPEIAKVSKAIRTALNELDHHETWPDQADLPTAAENVRKAVNGFIDFHGMDWPNRRQWAEYEKEARE